MKERLKEQYEAPATKRTRVEMENGICATSVTAHPGGDVGGEGSRHVKINHQVNGNKESGGSFDFSGNSWE
ncbi:hypothetical protein QVO32_02375 [Bacteroides gallinaceum]|uniref:hypothetical protein n=1 Tax=Bacteroides gallinaceum TaxID=1462571 RepID=UPI0025AA3AA9|nr:hypothetical protein [Bacteroides gallinaceum]MDN0078267.1 hypothetical protein [Bacteroides gallinaceum]